MKDIFSESLSENFHHKRFSGQEILILGKNRKKFEKSEKNQSEKVRALCAGFYHVLPESKCVITTHALVSNKFKKCAVVKSCDVKI